MCQSYYLKCLSLGTIYSYARSLHEEWTGFCTSVFHYSAVNIQWPAWFEGSDLKSKGH